MCDKRQSWIFARTQGRDRLTGVVVSIGSSRTRHQIEIADAATTSRAIRHSPPFVIEAAENSVLAATRNMF